MAGYLKSKRPDGMNRRVHQAMADLDRRTSFHVYDSDGQLCGSFRSLDEARGCVEFDGLDSYAIVKGDWNLVEGRFA